MRKNFNRNGESFKDEVILLCLIFNSLNMSCDNKSVQIEIKSN